jgi:hypothetical protein
VAAGGIVAVLAGCGPTTLAGSATKAQPTSGSSQPAMAGSGSGPASPSATTAPPSASGSYTFKTLDDSADLTFNQTLGINNEGTIAAYFGSGAQGHPNKGYGLTYSPGGFRLQNENVPGSTQTQVTGLNDRGVTVGFWSDMNNANQTNDNFGFYDVDGSFRSVKYPASSNSNPPVNQLLGVNDEDVAVGFYTDASGNSHGYTYSIRTGKFGNVTIPGATSVTASAINNSGDIAGFFANSAGTTDSFLWTGRGHVTTLSVPGASATQALGVNDSKEVVGVYTIGSGSGAVTHGFTWSAKHGFKTVDDPNGAGTTTINGVNDQGDIVGFYTDTAGNTDGFAAVPGANIMIPNIAGLTTTPTAAASPTQSSSMSQPTMAPTTGATSRASTAPTTGITATQPARQPGPTPSAPATGPLAPVHW